MRNPTLPRYKPKNYDNRICENCGSSYKPRSHNQRLCSNKCREEFQYNYGHDWWLRNRGCDKPVLRNWYKKEWETRNPGLPYTGKELRLWHGAKSRAKISGIDFSIEIYDIVIPDVCPIMKLRLEPGTRLAPSLDRIDPKKGYVKDNIWVISKIANRIKTDATEEELRRFSEWVLKN